LCKPTVQVKETLLKCSQFANVHSQCIHYKAIYLPKTFHFRYRGGYINVAMTNAKRAFKVKGDSMEYKLEDLYTHTNL